ncbi:MAG: hypothetical protein PVF63_04515 [Gammaproteobacteria bacterium]|jgi:hypothetical protein
MIAAIEDSFLGEFMRAYWWTFPAAEALHFIGLCLLVGSLAIIDLRLLGFAKSLPVRAIHSLLLWTWIGFGINLATGILFIFTQASFYYPNTSFWIKMVLILLAGVNALWFQRAVNRDLENWADGADAPTQAKAIAGISLALWVAVIFFGRFIMYWPPI